MRDSDIDALSADGAQDRWPDDEEGLSYRIGTTDRTEPRTAAGRALLSELVNVAGKPNDRLLRGQILAIEAEAAEPAPLDAHLFRVPFDRDLTRLVHLRDLLRCCEAAILDEEAAR